jgi:CheY-like chemotaxis protein
MPLSYPAPLTHKPAQLDRMPIIQIENDIDDQHLVQQALTAMGINNPVIFFQNGRQALDYLQTTTDHPLVILCDVKMPVMNGLELRRHIDADERLRTKAIPFVFFSTWGTQELVNEAYEGTIQGYHLKGDSFEELKSELALIVAYWKRCLHPRSF